MAVQVCSLFGCRLLPHSVIFIRTSSVQMESGLNFWLYVFLKVLNKSMLVSWNGGKGFCLLLYEKKQKAVRIFNCSLNTSQTKSQIKHELGGFVWVIWSFRDTYWEVIAVQNFWVAFWSYFVNCQARSSQFLIDIVCSFSGPDMVLLQTHGVTSSRANWAVI